MMMYSCSMIMLTLVSMMIGLALPSSVMTQQKIAKGSKKNPPPSSQQEEIPVEVIVPQTLPLEQLEVAVTEAVLRTVGHLTSNLDLHTTGTTKTECVEFYADFVACYDAILTIASDDVKNAFAISVLKDRLENGVDQNSIFVSSNTKGYPNVQVKNDTPYPVAHAAEESWGEG